MFSTERSGKFVASMTCEFWRAYAREVLSYVYTHIGVTKVCCLLLCPHTLPISPSHHHLSLRHVLSVISRSHSVLCICVSLWCYSLRPPPLPHNHFDINRQFIYIYIYRYTSGGKNWIYVWGGKHWQYPYIYIYIYIHIWGGKNWQATSDIRSLFQNIVINVGLEKRLWGGYD